MPDQKKPSGEIVAVIHLTKDGAIVHDRDCPVTQEANALLTDGVDPASPSAQEYLQEIEKQTHTPNGSRTFSIPWGSGYIWDGTAGRKKVN